MKTVEFKNRNFKIVNLEFCDKDVYFSIEIGSKQMNFCGEVSFNITLENGDHVIDSVDLRLEQYDWEHVFKSGFLNQRNRKLVCEAIEEIVLNEPELCGFDMEVFENDLLEWHEDLNYQIKREQCY
jgi:uncharacterized membrane protein